jgi:hypothetical protein
VGFRQFFWSSAKENIALYPLLKLVFNRKCPDGGIGRRAGLKHQYLHGYLGSTPSSGTASTKGQCNALAFFVLKKPSSLLEWVWKNKKAEPP